MANRFFSIGHSNRTSGEFLDLLIDAGVGIVVDVRKIPKSRSNPQFGSEALSANLRERAIRYEHVAELGGLRGHPSGLASPNMYWTNESFRNYADYALTQQFREGLERLLEIGRERPCAFMCAEAVWWRCHRRIITDYLINAGEPVVHILGPGRVEEARMNPAVRVVSGGLIYPADDTAGDRA